MGKRAFLAFFLSLLIISGYNYIVSQKYPQLQKAVSPAKQIPAPTILAQTPRTEQKSASFLLPAKEGKEYSVETDLMKLTVTSSGARIKSCQLREHPEEKLELESIHAQISQLESALAGAGSETREFLRREKNKLELLLEKLEQKAEGVQLVSLAASVEKDFSPAIIFPGEERINSNINTATYKSAQGGLRLNKDRPFGRLEFSYTDAQGRSIRKIYSFSNSNYIIDLDISFSGWQNTDFPDKQFLLFYGPDVGMPQAKRARRAPGYVGPVSCFQTGQQSWVMREKYARNEKDVFIRREHSGQGQILWTGLENKYFLTALIPLQPAQSIVIEKNRSSEQKVALAVPWDGPGPYRFKLYLGPKRGSRLKEAGVSLEKSIDYGFFSPIARLIYKTLIFFSRWTSNFGWAIVLLCLVTKIIFYPLTHRSFESMQKMQREMKTVQPEMTALREKFKDNSQKLNKEIMELYRKKGINPLSSCQSGCLPLILQMPVFFALYGVLYNSIELRGVPFLGWITDLSAKDPYYVLPVLMGISMFAQQKLTGMGEAAGGAQQQQAKMMSFMMPIFLTWIFASLPAGVVLYWLTFNIATALQQLLIRRKQQATATP